MEMKLTFDLPYPGTNRWRVFCNGTFVGTIEQVVAGDRIFDEWIARSVMHNTEDARFKTPKCAAEYLGIRRLDSVETHNGQVVKVHGKYVTDDEQLIDEFEKAEAEVAYLNGQDE